MCVCVCVCVKSLSHVQLFETPWTVTLQTSLSMAVSRQEYSSGLPCPLPGDLVSPGLPDLGIESGSPALQAGSLSSEPPGNRLARYIQYLKNWMYTK